MTHEGLTREDVSQRLFDLLIEPTTRRILSAVADDGLPVKELADRCGVSGRTMYRKVDRLREFDLLQADTKIDPNGNHYTVYESNVERVRITMTPGEREIDVDVTFRSSTDQFVNLWEGLKQK